MRPLPRVLTLAAVLSLGALFFLPLWRISLTAPQYPEGVVMHIWLDRLSGQLDLINRLNHYIGMRPIREENFPEFTLMPWLVGGLILLGILAVLLNRRWYYTAWLVLFAALIVVGLIDFYRWGYEYGHNLDPNAPIKVPEMSYQPPLLGSKQLLNFTAYSYPAAGGLIAFASFLLAAATVTAECIIARRHGNACIERTAEEAVEV